MRVMDALFYTPIPLQPSSVATGEFAPMNPVPTRSLVFLAVALGLIVFRPAWPTKTTDVICAGSVRNNVGSVFADMDLCVAAMSRAAATGTQCFCSVQQPWLSSAYYLGLVPLVLISGVW